MRDGTVSGDNYGDQIFHDQVSFSQGVGIANTPGAVYYVDRNTGTSGDGKSWKNAFLTIGEAIAQVNLDYTNTTTPSGGRNRVIYIAEGWYIEVPSATNLVLTANDVTIIGVAPGNHDSVVLYGSSVAGTGTIGSGFPALTIQGYNNTVQNIGFFTYDNTEPCLRIGGHTGGSTGQGLATGTKIINCSMVRNAADGAAVGIESSDQDGCLIQGCYFGTSCKDAGIKIISNGSTNPVNHTIRDCQFIGTPIGVDVNAGSQCIVRGCVFINDDSDRTDDIDTPIDATGATNTVAYNNYSESATNTLVNGGTDSLAINNFTLVTPA